MIVIEVRVMTVACLYWWLLDVSVAGLTVDGDDDVGGFLVVSRFFVGYLLILLFSRFLGDESIHGYTFSSSLFVSVTSIGLSFLFFGGGFS